jgi:hypothetical protein
MTIGISSIGASLTSLAGSAGGISGGLVNGITTFFSGWSAALGLAAGGYLSTIMDTFVNNLTMAMP